jgi:hypothetical protein
MAGWQRKTHTVLDRVVAAVIQQLLGALHGDGALGGEQPGRPNGRGQRGGLGLVHLADKADGERLGGAELARRQAHVLDPRLAADGFW